MLQPIPSGLAVFGGVDVEFSEDFAGVVVDDDDVEVVDEESDGFAFVLGADSDVVEGAAAAEADGAVGVDLVGADAVVALPVGVGSGFGSGGVLLVRGAAV